LNNGKCKYYEGLYKFSSNNIIIKEKLAFFIEIYLGELNFMLEVLNMPVVLPKHKGRARVELYIFTDVESFWQGNYYYN